MVTIAPILLIAGILFLFKPVIAWFINLRNTVQGTKTHISSGTLLFYRVMAIGLIIISLIYLV